MMNVIISSITINIHTG